MSDFGVMEVITWDRALSDAEMLTTVEYLQWKLKVRHGEAGNDGETWDTGEQAEREQGSDGFLFMAKQDLVSQCPISIH